MVFSWKVALLLHPCFGQLSVTWNTCDLKMLWRIILFPRGPQSVSLIYSSREEVETEYIGRDQMCFRLCSGNSARAHLKCQIIVNDLESALVDAENRNIHLACGFCFDNAMMWQIKFVQTNLWALDWSILSIRIFVKSKNTIGCNLPHKQNSLSNYTNKHNLQFGTVC